MDMSMDRSSQGRSQGWMGVETFLGVIHSGGQRARSGFQGRAVIGLALVAVLACEASLRVGATLAGD